MHLFRWTVEQSLSFGTCNPQTQNKQASKNKTKQTKLSKKQKQKKEKQKPSTRPDEFVAMMFYYDRI